MTAPEVGKVTFRRTLIGCGSMIEIPKKLAICPYCGNKLTVSFEAWEQQEDGKWAASELQVDCEGEPRMGSRGWRDWVKAHSGRPYVYMLPVEEKIRAWVNRHFFFEIEEEAKG